MDYRPTLGGMEPQEFLRDYWQKKPLIIRQAFPGFKTVVQPDELAGLACEEEVESRLIEQNPGKRAWQLRRGPFTAKDFKKLPETNWTLLVQGVDQLLPEVAAIKEKFRFIPDWRIDDVMISYSVDQGGVGPHVDNYDVFLLQGLGRRRWQVGGAPIVEEELLDGCDLRVLKSFAADETFELETGDMLYVPPRFAHSGVSLGEGMTYSIGFRSPSHADLLASHAAQCIEKWDEKDRLVDPDLVLQIHPAEIRPPVISKVVNWLKSLSPEAADVQRWFGRMVTAPKTASAFGEGNELSAEEAYKTLSQLFEEGKKGKKSSLIRGEDARLAFIDATDNVLLFVNGEEFLFPKKAKKFVSVLTKNFRIDSTEMMPFWPEYASFLKKMVETGVFYCETTS